MGIFGGVLNPVSELTVDLTSGTGITVNVGHADIAQINYLNGSEINAAIAAVTDISDPDNTGGWTDVIDLSGSKMEVFVGSALVNGIVYMRLDNTEDSGDALRAQILVDNTIVADITCIANNSDVIANYIAHHKDFGGNAARRTCFECNTSFKIRAARKGSLTDVDTDFSIGPVVYQKLI